MLTVDFRFCFKLRRATFMDPCFSISIVEWFRWTIRRRIYSSRISFVISKWISKLRLRTSCSGKTTYVYSSNCKWIILNNHVIKNPDDWFWFRYFLTVHKHLTDPTGYFDADYLNKNTNLSNITRVKDWYIHRIQLERLRNTVWISYLSHLWSILWKVGPKRSLLLGSSVILLC